MLKCSAMAQFWTTLVEIVSNISLTGMKSFNNNTQARSFH